MATNNLHQSGLIDLEEKNRLSILEKIVEPAPIIPPATAMAMEWLIKLTYHDKYPLKYSFKIVNMQPN